MISIGCYPDLARNVVVIRSGEVARGCPTGRRVRVVHASDASLRRLTTLMRKWAQEVPHAILRESEAGLTLAMFDADTKGVMTSSQS